MRRDHVGGFKLTDLLVVIFLLGALFTLFVPAIGTHCELRRDLCMHNLKQLTLATQMWEQPRGKYPGYVNDIELASGDHMRASWSLALLPHLDQSELWAEALQGRTEFPALEMFRCPQDTSADSDLPHLSYVANAGFIGNVGRQENRANGVFLDLTRTVEGAAGPRDERDIAELPLVTMRTTDIKDGASSTILLTESVGARHWYHSSSKGLELTPDRKFHFGVCWEQPKALEQSGDPVVEPSLRGTRGKTEGADYSSFEQMNADATYPSSVHPGVFVVAFVGGNMKYISKQIDPFVYAQLMTSNVIRSDLEDREGMPEKMLPPLRDEDYWPSRSR